MQTIKTKFVLSLFSWVLITAGVFGQTYVRWEGDAQDVAQVDTITIGGDWSATDETFTITCNGKAVVVTTGATMDTTAEVAAGIAEAINADSTEGLTNDMTISAGGQQYGEFHDFEATVSGSVVTLTSTTPGVPFTVSVAETSAGTATLSAEATAATGKHHFDNGANWSTGSVPAEDNIIVFDQGSTDVRYGLDNTTEDLSLVRRNGYQGNIGLLPRNTTHPGFPYDEYRQARLDLPTTASTGSQVHLVGELHSTVAPVGYTFVDLGTNDGTLQNFRVYSSPLPTETVPYSVDIAGGNDCSVTLHRGSLAIGRSLFDTDSEVGSIQLTATGAQASGTVLYLGENLTLESSTSITMNGGELITEEEATTTGAILDMRGGICRLRSPLATANIRNGATLYRVSGVITNAYVFNGGTLDASESFAAAITNLTLYRGYTLKDNGSVTYSNGIDFVGCSPASNGFQVPDSQTWTPSAL